MRHRHLNHKAYTAAAIDDVIARGGREDWEELRRAVLADRSLAEVIRRISSGRVSDPYAQRYHFWMHYVSERFT